MFSAVTTPHRNVSIHAFRGEGDSTAAVGTVRLTKFQSTPSGGKATSQFFAERLRGAVSIHAFRGEGDIASGTRL